ncbi:AAA family ATPase [Bacillota bacterium Meth-B3]|nr:AAA family ATPase [Christensenellaceae bacterium]
MDAKDAIIFQQLDVIRQMTERNLRRVGDDFWGAPRSPVDDAAPPSGGARDVSDGPGPGSAPQQAAAGTADAGEKTAPPPEDIEDLKQELDGYIGLARVKREVSDLINLMSVYKLRKAHELPTVDMSLHMVFSGNPGTGKTMIARLMARVYRSLGFLEKGQLVEVDRSGLVAGYVGQTAIKTGEVVDKAMNGVLFIDEAYALTQRRGENDFGQEAVDTLLKAMEDHRDELIVIAAGYDELMQGFIRSNPGLTSRFNRFIHFEDYTVDEMAQIFEMQCKKGCYTLDDEAKAAVRAYIEAESADSGNFGNARGVRNLFEKVLVNQANRLSALSSVDREQLMALTADDVRAARDADAPNPEDDMSEGMQALKAQLDALDKKS